MLQVAGRRQPAHLFFSFFLQGHCSSPGVCISFFAGF
jgi:hypothetical protein